MADYLETNIAGRQWRRCAIIEIHNPPLPERSVVRFRETDVVEVGDKIVTVGQSSFDIKFDPAATFDLLNPDTLEPTGSTATELDIYVMLFSRYIAGAKDRDEQQLIEAQKAIDFANGINNIQVAEPL
jgi:hypothetical protein